MQFAAPTMPAAYSTMAFGQAVQAAQPAMKTSGTTFASPSMTIASQPAAAMPIYQGQAQVVAAQQAEVTARVGDWQIARDNMGEFYFHTPTGQSFDQAPVELLQILQQVTPSQQMALQQSCAVYGQSQYAAVAAQTPSYLGQPHVKQAGPVAQAPAQYMAASQPAVVSYTQTPQVAQAPAQYMAASQPAVVIGTQQPQVSQAAATSPAVVKATVGAWQILEDGLGEFYCHMPTGQTFDQAPAELLQLLR